MIPAWAWQRPVATVIGGLWRICQSAVPPQYCGRLLPADDLSVDELTEEPRT